MYRTRIVHGYDPANPDPVLMESFRQRYTLYIERLKWPLPDAKNGLEIDQYDRADSLYLVMEDAHGALCASTRLIRADAGTMMLDVFGDHLLTKPDLGPLTYEGSRICILEADKQKRTYLEGAIGAAVLEACLLYGIRKLLHSASALILPEMLASGWVLRPLSRPIGRGADKIILLEQEIDTETLARHRAYVGLTAPLLVPAGAAAA